MAELSPRRYFLSVTLETLLNEVSQDEYVQEMLQGIIDFVRDDAKWNNLSAEERQETEALLAIVNDRMEKVAESKAEAVDSHATQTHRGGLINALFRLRAKAENAAKQ